MYNENKKTARAYGLLTMIYITLVIAANLIIYKTVDFFSISFSAGSFLIPLWYVVGDIIAEVYGYKVFRRVIWQSIFCSFLFTFVCYLLIELPSPANWNKQPAFDYIFGDLPRVFIGSILAIVGSQFLNGYLITRWRILVKGKYFALRSVCCSGVGQIIFTLISLSFDQFGNISTHMLTEMITVSLLIKFVATLFFASPAMLAIIIIRHVDGIPSNSETFIFNPFLSTKKE